MLVDPCPTDIQRRSDERWSPVQGLGVNSCTAKRELLAAGDTLFAFIDLPRALGDGTYRARFDRIRGADGRSQVSADARVSNAFTVRCADFRCRRREQRVR